jgi:putative PIN family toxin of toxin-antitoxin system
MKVFLDTNVIYSAYLLHSLAINDYLKKIINNKHVLCTSDYCLNELSRIFQKLKVDSKDMFIKIVNDIESVAFSTQIKVVIDNPKMIKYKTNDPNDDRVLNAAINSGANILLTGDKGLLSYKSDLIRIIAPSQLSIYLNN